MRTGPSFELTAHLIQAVSVGIGFVLVPDILVQDELKSGALIALFDPMESDRNYYLACATRCRHLPALETFSADCCPYRSRIEIHGTNTAAMLGGTSSIAVARPFSVT